MRCAASLHCLQHGPAPSDDAADVAGVRTPALRHQRRVRGRGSDTVATPSRAGQPGVDAHARVHSVRNGYQASAPSYWCVLWTEELVVLVGVSTLHVMGRDAATALLSHETTFHSAIAAAADVAAVFEHARRVVQSGGGSTSGAHVDVDGGESKGDQQCGRNAVDGDGAAKSRSVVVAIECPCADGTGSGVGVETVASLQRELRPADALQCPCAAVAAEVLAALARAGVTAEVVRPSWSDSAVDAVFSSQPSPLWSAYHLLKLHDTAARARARGGVAVIPGCGSVNVAVGILHVCLSVCASVLV